MLTISTFTISNEGIKIEQIKDEMEGNLLKIFLVNENNEIDIAPKVSKKQVEEVKDLLTNYYPNNKIKYANIEMKIIVKNEKAISQGTRHLPFSERKIVEERVEEWIRNEIIEPCESKYASPVVLVRNKDGTARLCIDYRKINDLVVAKCQIL